MDELNRMYLQDIEAMPANAFHKEEFRKMLSDAEAMNLKFYYLGKLLGYDSQLLLVDTTSENICAVDEAYVKGEAAIRRLASILEFAVVSMVREGYTVKHALGFAVCALFRNEAEMMDVKMSLIDDEGVRYLRTSVVGPVPDDLKKFQIADVCDGLMCFPLPIAMGALFETLERDRRHYAAH